MAHEGAIARSWEGGETQEVRVPQHYSCHMDEGALGFLILLFVGVPIACVVAVFVITYMAIAAVGLIGAVMARSGVLHRRNSVTTSDDPIDSLFGSIVTRPK